jgi:hypothetical protein
LRATYKSGWSEVPLPAAEGCADVAMTPPYWRSRALPQEITGVAAI